MPTPAGFLGTPALENSTPEIFDDGVKRVCVCGGTVPLSRGNRPRLYCSPRCKQRVHNARYWASHAYRAKRPKPTGICACGSAVAFPPRGKKCAECLRRSRALGRIEWRRACRARAVPRYCPCGAKDRLVGNAQRCPPCSAASRERKRKGHGRGPHRAKVYGVARQYFNPLRVFERDGWRCQICGCRTPAELRGTYKPTAPEIDHIVPLACGGGHVWENVQTACRACNGAKGARPLGQVWLFGRPPVLRATA